MNKTLLVILGLIILVVIVTAASLYFIPKLVVKSSLPMRSQINSPAIFTTPEPIIPRDKSVSTAVTQNQTEWKTMTTQSGLNFKYPPEWKAQEVTKNNVVLYTPDLLDPPKGTPISVYLNESSSFDQVLSVVKQIMKNPQESAITVGNLTGTQLTGSITVAPLGEVQMISTVLNFQNKAIVAEYSVYPEATDYRQVYNDIVKSISVLSP